jgi:hypothetical protein
VLSQGLDGQCKEAEMRFEENLSIAILYFSDEYFDSLSKPVCVTNEDYFGVK